MYLFDKLNFSYIIFLFYYSTLSATPSIVSPGIVTSNPYIEMGRHVRLKHHKVDFV